MTYSDKPTKEDVQYVAGKLADAQRELEESGGAAEHVQRAVAYWRKMLDAATGDAR